MWSYISFRAILTLVLSLVISAWFGEWFIKYMKRHNLSEEQRDAITDPYGVEKKGVPTMGGVIIIVSTLIPVLLFGRLRNIYLLLMVGTTIVELTDISESIVIDSVLREAYLGNTLMNDNMSGEFPVLKPGMNAISWTGEVARVVVRPNWRYL